MFFIWRVNAWSRINLSFLRNWTPTSRFGRSTTGARILTAANLPRLPSGSRRSAKRRIMKRTSHRYRRTHLTWLRSLQTLRRAWPSSTDDFLPTVAFLGSGLSTRKRQFSSHDAHLSDDETVAKMGHPAQNDTWQVPTLLIQYTYAFVDPYELHDSPGVRYVPPSAVNSWIERLNAFRRSRDDSDMEAQKRSYELELQVVRMMHRSGVHFTTGTDAETFYPAGFGLHMELGLLVSAGFSTLEALQAATLNPAVYFGKTKDLGTVEVGKLADLLLL